MSARFCEHHSLLYQFFFRMLLLQRTAKCENPDKQVETNFYETLDTFDGNHLKEALKQFHQWYIELDSVKKKGMCGSQSFASVRHYSCN